MMEQTTYSFSLSHTSAAPIIIPAFGNKCNHSNRKNLLVFFIFLRLHAEKLLELFAGIK